MGGAKRKSAFEHAKNVRIHIILRMRKCSSALLLSIDIFFWQWAAKALISCAYAQADLGFRFPHMLEEKIDFSE